MPPRSFPHSSNPFWGLHRVLLALCLAWVAPLRAQVLLSSAADPALPAPHSPIISLAQVGSSLWFVSTGEAWTSPLGTGTVFTRFDVNSYPLLGTSLRDTSLIAPAPSDDRHIYLTGGPTLLPIQQLFRFGSRPPTSFASVVLLVSPSPPKGLAADPASSALFYSHPTTRAGIVKIASDLAGVPVLTFGNSGPGALNTPGAMAFGPNGLLYVLDTGDNRVVSFDTAGNYQNAFALTGPAESTALAIDSRGFLYTADGHGGGSIYNAATGQYHGSLTATASNPDGGTGKTSLAVDNLNHLYLYDQTTGLHVFDVSAVPEPAATGAVVAGALLIGCLHRRRRK